MRRGVALLLFCTKKFGQFDALLEYGVEKEGYWTGEKFMENVKDACKLMTQVMPTLFCGCSINQAARAFAEDALNVRRMNVQPGGAQPAMRDTMWGRRVQKMVMEDGTPKGKDGVGGKGNKHEKYEWRRYEGSFGQPRQF